MAVERRKMVRRQADRELLERFRASQGADDPDNRAQRHMRRRAIRHNCEVRIGLRLRQSSGNLDVWTESELPVAGRLLDLSEEGCSLFTKDRLEMGQELHLAVALKNAQTFEGTGVVRWAKAVPEKHGFASGVQFTALQPNAQKNITAFLKHLDATIGL